VREKTSSGRNDADFHIKRQQARQVYKRTIPKIHRHQSPAIYFDVCWPSLVQVAVCCNHHSAPSTSQGHHRPPRRCNRTPPLFFPGKTLLPSQSIFPFSPPSLPLSLSPSLPPSLPFFLSLFLPLSIHLPIHPSIFSVLHSHQTSPLTLDAAPLIANSVRSGYSYSGPAAGYAYRHMDPSRIRRVFILGPSHHFYLAGAHL